MEFLETRDLATNQVTQIWLSGSAKLLKDLWSVQVRRLLHGGHAEISEGYLPIGSVLLPARDNESELAIDGDGFWVYVTVRGQPGCYRVWHADLAEATRA